MPSESIEPPFNSLVVDPPWQYRNRDDTTWPADLITDGSRRQHKVASHRQYGSMSLADLYALPVGEWAADRAHLYLWTTNQMMCEAHDLARGWGFEPKTILTWGKVQDDGQPSRKMGYWYRSATEHIVFAVRGQLRLVNPDPAPSTLMLHRRLPHSVKPEAFYDMVERYSPGPYLEVFSRRARLGWSTWGDEALHGTGGAHVG
jgi:N6-adenosine-specific RNA methylase IME4